MAGHRLVVEVEFDKEKFENMIDAYKATHPDLIDVVRCRGCLYGRHQHAGKVFCIQICSTVPLDFYCAYGRMVDG